VKQTGYLLGATMPMGAGDDPRSLTRVSKTNAATFAEDQQVALGYVHNLSKRTAVYGTFARVGNSGGATPVLNGAVTACQQQLDRLRHRSFATPSNCRLARVPALNDEMKSRLRAAFFMRTPF
jgi:predicted porin